MLLPNGVLQAPPWVDLPMQAPLHVSAKQLAPQCCNRGKQQKAFLLEGTGLTPAAAAGPQVLKTAMLCSLCCRPMQARQEAESRALRTHQAQECGSCCDMLWLWLRGYLHRASTMGLRPLKHACAAEHQDLTIHALWGHHELIEGHPIQMMAYTLADTTVRDGFSCDNTCTQYNGLARRA